MSDSISEDLKNVFEAEPAAVDKAAEAKNKSEWDMEDIISMYEEGYAAEDIGTAMKLAPKLGTKPYTLLEKKGKPEYEAHELTAEEAALVKETRTANNASELALQRFVNPESVFMPQEEVMPKVISEIQNRPLEIAKEQPQYSMEKIEEKSWETVIAQINGDTAAADTDMQTIKDNRFIEFIDEPVFTDTELEYLSGIENSADEQNINLTAANITDDLITDTYNNYIFPTSLYSHYNAGNEHSDNEDISVNMLTRNATVRATDLSLPGKNGLDLNLTRVNSSMNTGDIRPVVKKTQASTTSESHYFYSVTGYAKVTVEYREPLSNGQYTKIFDSEEIIFKPYVSKIGLTTEYDIAGYSALIEDRARLSEGRMPVSMFTDRNDAVDVKNKAMSGEYDVKYNFSESCKIKSIQFNVIDDDIIKVNDEGYHTVMTEMDGTDIYYTDWYDYTVTEQYANIGMGWEYDFPYIERLYGNTNGDQGNQDYLHFGAKGVWRIDDDYNLDGYYLKDIAVDSGGSFEGEDCYMTVTEKGGKNYYFGDYGQLMGIEDRYGNKIRFEYNTIRRYDGHIYPYQLTKIIDSVGREINFDYTNPLQTVITVTDENDSSQNRVIKYNKELVIDEGEDSEYILSSVIDAENNETIYNYQSSTIETSLTDKDLDGNDYIEIPHYYILTILKPSEMQIKLTTDTRLGNCGSDGVTYNLETLRYEYREPNNEAATSFKNCIEKNSA